MLGRCHHERRDIQNRASNQDRDGGGHRKIQTIRLDLNGIRQKITLESDCTGNRRSHLCQIHGAGRGVVREVLAKDLTTNPANASNKRCYHNGVPDRLYNLVLLLRHRTVRVCEPSVQMSHSMDRIRLALDFGVSQGTALAVSSLCCSSYQNEPRGIARIPRPRLQRASARRTGRRRRRCLPSSNSGCTWGTEGQCSQISPETALSSTAYRSHDKGVKRYLAWIHINTESTLAGCSAVGLVERRRQRTSGRLWCQSPRWRVGSVAGLHSGCSTSADHHRVRLRLRWSGGRSTERTCCSRRTTRGA